ncbi:MAG: GAF domain-containing protein [Thermodesulfobacteriota bacterium]
MDTSPSSDQASPLAADTEEHTHLRQDADKTRLDLLLLSLNSMTSIADTNAREALFAHARLAFALDSLDALVYIADMHTHEVLYLNRYGRELFGDVSGQTCWKALQQGMTGPCPFCTNHLLLAPNGTPAEAHGWEFQNTATGRWYQMVDRAIPWTDGRMVRLEIATDITSHKESETRLRLDEERVRLLLNLSSRVWESREELADQALEDAVHLTGSTVGYLHFMDPDQETIELFSWSKAVKEHCSAAKQIHYPMEQAGIWADCVRLRRPVFHNDYPNAPGRKGYPEGHFPVLRHMSVPVMDGDRIVAVCGVGNKEAPYNEWDARQLTLYILSMWSILRQKQDELVIRQAKKEWEQTFDAIDEAISIHDHSFTIILANQAAGQLLGVEPAALVGRKCHEVFRGEAVPCEGCPSTIARETGRTAHAEIRHARLNKIFETTYCPITDNRGQITGFVQIAKDITEKANLQDQLRQAQKMEAVGTLAGGIAHDFNNILTPILGYTEMALERSEADSLVASDLEQVYKAGIRAKELVKQILTFSRQTSQERKPLQLHLVVKEALKLLRATLPTSIEIRQRISTTDDTVRADPTQIHQVLMNLCTNAYHAMKAKQSGVLGVEVNRVTLEEPDIKLNLSGLSAGPYVQLVVSDSGDGMDRATLAKIFEPYFTTKPQGEGTGLGLAVVHGIMRTHEGHISVYSEPGKGTSFHLYFPAIAATTPTVGAGILNQPLSSAKNERILVVDDESEVVNMYKHLLDGLGYRVEPFTDCEEAMKAIRTRSEDFDLVLTDMTMPKMNGLDLAKEVMAVRPGLPVILCTGFSELINEESAREHGISAYLTKPVHIRELATTLRTTLDSK